MADLANVRLAKDIRIRGKELTREEELLIRFQDLKSSLDMIPGIDNLQLDVIERISYLALCLADYEEKIIQGTAIDMKQYTQTLDVYNRLVKTLFDGTQKMFSKAVLERMFIEKTMAIVADTVRDPVIIHKVADRLEGLM